MHGFDGKHRRLLPLEFDRLETHIADNSQRNLLVEIDPIESFGSIDFDLFDDRRTHGNDESRVVVCEVVVADAHSLNASMVDARLFALLGTQHLFDGSQ